jgi:hypothetical protein
MDAEITDSQVSMIMALLDKKRVSLKWASRVIQELLEMPDISDDGLKTPNLKP